tara:strand:- start:126 stop:662 length:537 start_codon:yes stop_codon:yes gene_type:complete
MANSKKLAELSQLGILLGIVAIFYFIVIPVGILDPEGMSLNDGLPPSFSARLVAILASVLMIIRFLQILCIKPSGMAQGELHSSNSADITGGNYSKPQDIPVRGILSMSVGLVFAYLLTPLLGFFPAGFILLVVLLKILGETRTLFLILPPVIVTIIIWLLFGQILSIRLPDGIFLGG